MCSRLRAAALGPGFLERFRKTFEVLCWRVGTTCPVFKLPPAILGHPFLAVRAGGCSLSAGPARPSREVLSCRGGGGWLVLAAAPPASRSLPAGEDETVSPQPCAEEALITAWGGRNLLEAHTMRWQGRCHLRAEAKPPGAWRL